MAARQASAALHAAIDWMVVLRSGEASAEDLARHRAWLAADRAHIEAWAEVQGAVRRSVEPLAQESGSAAGAAMQAALLRPARRRALRNIAAWAGLAAGAGWLIERQWPVAAMLADARTGTAERREIVLDDGSRLMLNARSAVDIDLGAAARVVRLHAGELIATAAADAARPFIVRTAEGEVRALGTRFLVRQEPERTMAMVLSRSVRLHTRSGAERTLAEGQAAYFDAAAIGEVQPARAGLADWARGMLVADDQPLAEVIAALRPYREGFIRLSPEAARLRVLGAFPLDDADRVLDSLAQTLPIRVTRYGGWLVVVDPKPA